MTIENSSTASHDTSQDHLKAADDAAFREWAWKVYKRGRKPEGEFDGDSGKFQPTAREAGIENPTPRAPRSFQSWMHVCALCRRARKGENVPQDIAESFQADYGKINERHIKGAVNEQLKKESDDHARAQRRQRALEKSFIEKSSAARLAERQKALIRIDSLIKKREAQIKALMTRRSRVTRSIGALERAAAKK